MDTTSAVTQMPMDFVNVTAVVITGLVVVFIGLILLVAIIYIFGSIMDKANKAKSQKTEKAPSAPVKAAAPAPAPVKAVSDDEVIAVISAAVAAMSLADGKTYAVRSIRQKPAGSANAWAGAARIENTRAF